MDDRTSQKVINRQQRKRKKYLMWDRYKEQKIKVSELIKKEI